MTDKTVAIGELFTAEELDRAKALYVAADPGTFARRCAEEIVAPILARINEKTGQENDARYLAYAIEYAMDQTRVRT